MVTRQFSMETEWTQIQIQFMNLIACDSEIPTSPVSNTS